MMILSAGLLAAQPGCQGNRLGAGNKRYAGLKHTDNIIFASYQPVDNGWGIGYSRTIRNRLGAYLCLSHGEYYVPGLSDKYKNVPHYQASLGATYGEKLFRVLDVYLLLGGSYNATWGMENEDWIKPLLDRTSRYSKFDHLSLEGGAGAKISPFRQCRLGFVVQVRIDGIRNESHVDIGIAF